MSTALGATPPDRATRATTSPSATAPTPNPPRTSQRPRKTAHSGTFGGDAPGRGRSKSGWFVTGTGTEVGKTVVAAALARTAAAAGARVTVFKPAVSGLEEYEATGVEPDHSLLRRASGSAQADDEIAPYRFGPAVSPHLAAELADEPIEPARLRAAVARAATGGEVLVCEGVGGFLVPLTRGYLVRDFARELALPVVIAASPGLGTINHTLLTFEAVRAAGLEVAAIVLTPWPARPSRLESDNREVISRLARAEVAVLPRLDLADPGTWPPLAPALGAGAPAPNGS